MTGKKRTRKNVVEGKFFALLAATSLTPDSHRDHVHLGQSYGRNCLLLGWPREPYAEAIKAVQEARPQVSEKTIAKVLSQSMVKLFDQRNVREDADPETDAPVLDNILETLDSSAVSDELARLLDLLKSSIRRWTVFAFLEGVELKGLAELPLGVATLYPRDHGPLLDVLQDLENIRGLDRLPARVEEFARHCYCYLTIDIEGEDHFVNQEALRQGQDVVSVLNLYTLSSPHRGSFYERVGILGQLTSTRPWLVFKRTPPIRENAPSPRYSYYEEHPAAFPHVIDSSEVQRWRKDGLDKVLECVGLPDITLGSAQSRIRNAITWYGTAMNAHTRDEQFVGLTIALESLLVADKKVSIAQRLADGVSGLLDLDFQSGERVAERVKELYEVRGHIVHGGVPVSQENLLALGSIVAKAILAFVRREVPGQCGLALP